MIGVAFDLRRPAFVALDEEADAGAGKRHRRRVEERLAGHQLFGLPHVGNDLLVRLPRAGADAGQRQRRAHQLQEAAAADRIEPLRGVLRELAMQEFLELGRLGDALRGCASTRGRGCLRVWRGAPGCRIGCVHERVTDGTSSSRAALDAVFLHELRAEHRLRHRAGGSPS